MYRYQNLDKETQQKIIQHAKTLINKKYDIYFSSNNEEIYCSELVVMAFGQLKINIGQFQKISELMTGNPTVLYLVQKRWKSHPACKDKFKTFDECWAVLKNDRLITPINLTLDKNVKLVYSNYK